MLTLNQLFGAREHEPVRRAYLVYRPDATNCCPGCGGQQWLVGRVSAECAGCGTALPLVDAAMTDAGLIRGTLRRPDGEPLAA
jgi:hypothetical protein